MITKAVMLAGGQSIRLRPASRVINKHLLPVYDKPLLYYTLSTLLLLGLKDILIVGNVADLPLMETLLGDGSYLGIRIRYTEQDRSGGIAHALLSAREFIGNDPVCVILGDNMFYGRGLKDVFLDSIRRFREGAQVFLYRVNDPERYGVAAFDEYKNITHIEEKPKDPPSNWAVTGLYFYDETLMQKVDAVKPSARGEMEITDVNNLFLKERKLHVEKLTRGIAWFDTGTPEAMLDASNFVQAIESRQGLKIGAVEEVAYHMQFITSKQLEQLAQESCNPDYRDYLLRVARGDD